MRLPPLRVHSRTVRQATMAGSDDASAVFGDVDDGAVRIPDEESTQSPLLVGQRVDDLGSGSPSAFIHLRFVATRAGVPIRGLTGFAGLTLRACDVGRAAGEIATMTRRASRASARTRGIGSDRVWPRPPAPNPMRALPPMYDCTHRLPGHRHGGGTTCQRKGL